MLMTAFTVRFVGAFVGLAALGHLLVLNAIVFGKASADEAGEQASPLTTNRFHIAR